MGKESFSLAESGVSEGDGLPRQSDNLGTHPRHSLDKEAGLPTCRVCHCAESDKRGDAALEFLGITPPLQEACMSHMEVNHDSKVALKDAESDSSVKKNVGQESRFLEFIGPDGEVFICSADIEMGACQHQDTLLELGCSCKNDLALVHYSCALKWFINHGSTVCEICGRVSKNIRGTDLKKVLLSLKEYESLRERTASGQTNPLNANTSTGVDPDAVAAIRRQRLSEISLWFSPHNNANGNSVAVSQVESEEPHDTAIVPVESRATKWAVEATAILLATGLLTVTVAWLLAPHVGKKTARSGLHILLGGICALTVVVFFRFFVLTRIKYGPARYWAILFVFWFLVFGIWASRTHGAHKT
ncbi:uncharacterized protein LOC126799317 [Argentina anserina]|uniref:uncharacterized protein LOC126799317 n=1 Tax=Argentina anserina TaxID=57926 RepID=UPI0021768391|nr:uncharacterized protein LOC126799317 [Potentilla anserina]XP_050382563.1 uncharacterized protein LOC126799317 [Potentilla anserina]XP_050382632.1 uncharacterized protein LOC126799317 [Potentilla anserina]XP_050382710.1 uncharacterized protein LOC126799317 [Potentilla anserina]XP_050382788.1 uncharacterized protein LOC126799317 [Potentilla anserina]XP_050382858.1 uncharacterized protein LOC126799317 [Potentilla anserina]XP_050382930.1 uncharacterized protein LOC126799317 [Potentilla anserin